MKKGKGGLLEEKEKKKHLIFFPEFSKAISSF